MRMKSENLMAIIEKVAPQYEQLMKFVYVDDEWGMSQRKLTGITWEELPALAISTTEFLSAAYPRYDPHDTESIEQWLKQVSVKKNLEAMHKTTNFAFQMKDTTIEKYFLSKTIKADRDIFDTQIIREDQDAVVLLYSTENINYLQRKACFQFNLAAETLKLDKTYGDLIPNYLKFYAYDTNLHGFPKGLPA
jgi:hypothetical protein